MPRLEIQEDESVMLLRPPSNCEIVFDRHIFDYILYELQRYPASEEGGKYVGYIELANRNRAKDRDYRVVITDFLPGGPNATRTAVEFLPDGEFQERLFREAERRDHNVEHVGTWHSHHCNGLNRLSGGDIGGYFKTINKAAYRPDLFVASLVKHLPKSSRDVNWIDHFLFVRNHDQFYKITHHVTIAEAPTRFGDITGHVLPRDPVAPTRTRPGDIESPTSWHETDIGRKTLAEDKRFFTERFGQDLRATRRDGVITIRCGKGAKFIAVTYPLEINDREVKISVGSASRTILSIGCDHSDRNVAYAASLTALEHF
jgi:hypothetical protein